MKLWDRLDTIPVIALIVISLTVAVVCEIIVLKDERMGQVYLIIIGLECLILAAVAKLVLNESYSMPELAGLALIIVGIAVYQLPTGQSQTVAEASIVKPASAGSHAAFGKREQAPLRVNKEDKLSL